MTINVKEIAGLASQLLKIPYDRVWSSYDKEAAVIKGFMPKWIN